jgi:hypothetical protein
VLLTSCHHPGAGREIIRLHFPPFKKNFEEMKNNNEKGGVRVQHLE